MSVTRFATRKAALVLGIMAAGLLALGVVGCGSKKEEKLFVDPSAPVINVTENEWQISLDRTTVNAGKVTFAIKNDGKNEHEFVILKTDTAADQLPVTDGKVVEDQAGTSPGEVENIAKGVTKSKTFDLEPGQYVFICNVEGHYIQGMHAAFTVE